METGMKIKTFENTDVSAYVELVHDYGFTCTVFPDYILVGKRLNSFNIDYKLFAQEIRKAMRDKNISRDDLARELGVTDTSVWNWYVGKSFPKDKNLNMLCKKLNINKDEFVKKIMKNN